MPNRSFTAHLHSNRFGTWFLALAWIPMVTGCATTTKDSAAGRIQDTPVKTSAPAVGQDEPDDGPDEIVERRTEDGTLQSRAEGWLDVDGNFVHHGAYTVYWENGQKKTELFYRNGERHGDRTSWHADGKLWKTGRHDSGRAVGTWVEYHANGVKAREMIFIKGGLNGWMTEWYPDGRIRHKVMYVKGLRQGRETRWDKDGTLMYEADFLDDILQP